MQNVEGLIRKAITDYNMIEDGDKIAVCLSGGKDSLTLLKCMKNLQRYSNEKFELLAICINPGFENFDKDLIKRNCEKIGVDYVIFDSQIKQIVFDERKEKNPCSLCANLRRGIINSVAIENKCNKIALGHNEDDVLETFLMNLIYGGKIGTISPVTYMSRTNMTMIRPLIYVSEKDSRSFARRNELEVMPKVCEMDGKSKREDALMLLRELESKYDNTRANMIGAIKRAKINGWHENLNIKYNKNKEE